MRRKVVNSGRSQVKCGWEALWMVCMVMITESRRRRNEDMRLFKAWRLERMVGCVQVVCR